MFIGENGDDWAKDEQYKPKAENWKALEHTKTPKAQLSNR